MSTTTVDHLPVPGPGTPGLREPRPPSHPGPRASVAHGAASCSAVPSDSSSTWRCSSS
ncbi:hypothetical protein [Curtobacterium sp. 24E2]|nr:hypothetical protein JN350_03825 [Curtobacterium sp. 24E2]